MSEKIEEWMEDLLKIDTCREQDDRETVENPAGGH